MCCKWLAENTGCKNDTKKSPYAHHRTIFCRAISLQLRHISKIRKKIVKQQYLLHNSSHNMANIGPLTAEIGLPVWGTAANLNGFRVLASLLQRRRSPEVNQTLHDLWPPPGLVHYICIFGGSCPLTEFCQVQNSCCVPSLAFSYICNVTARHLSSQRQPKFAACYMEWNYGTFTEGDTYIRLGGHHVGHCPTF